MFLPITSVRVTTFKINIIIFFCCNYVVFLTNGLFHVAVSKSSEWVHSVTNFVGPNNGQGIRVYHDGQLIGHDSRKSTFSPLQNPVNGKISIGKFDRYASVQVDELYFFSRVLHVSTPEIKILSLWPFEEGPVSKRQTGQYFRTQMSSETTFL